MITYMYIHNVDQKKCVTFHPLLILSTSGVTLIEIKYYTESYSSRIGP